MLNSLYLLHRFANATGFLWGQPKSLPAGPHATATRSK